MTAGLALRQRPTLERMVFEISRLAEFCGEKELTAQTGHHRDDWPLVILKELVDNALDACEETEIAPEITITVSTETGEITIADNGPGLPGDAIAGVTDYSVRVSSREAYVSPSRGQQGNALKCIVAMPYALDGTRGETLIESHGKAYRIVFEMDRVRREPGILPREISTSDVQTGTRITVRWPKTACHLLEDARGRFVQMAGNFTTFNPHLTLRMRWDDEEVVEVSATNPVWSKWRTGYPTSAHWYGPEQFERYMAAHIARDEDMGESGRTVANFIGELDGLRRPPKQQLVTAETGTKRVTLATLFAGGRSAIAALLDSCQRHTKPVKPEQLGLLGHDHVLEDCCANGAAEKTFVYRKSAGTTVDGLPYALEVGFAYCPRRSAARLITGVNFSVGIGSPFGRLMGYYGGLEAYLESLFVNAADPVVLVLHYVCPRVEFADRGKGTLTLPGVVGNDILRLVEDVTKKWTKEKRATIRREDAEERREERMLKEKSRPEKEAPVEPSGVLAETIFAAADKLGVPIDDLVVLSADNDPYMAWKRRREAEWFEMVFNRHGGRKHLRGLFYLVVMEEDPEGPDRKPLVNDYKHWQAFQKASKAARWLGLVPFDLIIDERNAPAEIYVPGVTEITTRVDPGKGCDVPLTDDAALPSLRLDGFRGRQTHRIIFYGEKSSLAVVLRPIAEKIGAEIILVTGESSHTRIEEAARRACEDGRPAVLFYFADFDPSGHQMPVSVARKLQAFRDLKFPNLNIKLYPVALTLDQVRSWNLPSAPLKETEKRAAAWKEKHDGHEQTEIDAAVALRPDELRAAVFDALAPFYDDSLDHRVADVEAEWRRTADDALQDHPDYEAVSERIKTAWKDVDDAVRKLHSEQREAAELLESSIPEAPELPEAEPPGEAKPALFDTNDDFVTSSRRLFRHKKLMEEED